MAVCLSVIQAIAEQDQLLGAGTPLLKRPVRAEQAVVFAVVADEVASPGARTQRSTRDIQEMIRACTAVAVGQ